MDLDISSIFYQLILAAFLGSLIGFEREVHGKAAGLRTYSLVSLGACLFTIVSSVGFADAVGYDPSRVASQVVVGIGFIGAGIIFVRGEEVQGLTTAAGLWIAGAIGMAVGVKLYLIAIFAALLVLFVLWILKFVERPFHKDEQKGVS
ncbi:MAG: MgtC/SapB family protein [Candidatus Sungbacteria bacterium]|nr:MgtC/SapB family protein [Candidatus Sungbacteria bacterium]